MENGSSSDSEDEAELEMLMEYERVKKEREEREREELKEKMAQGGVNEAQGYSLQKKWFQETAFQNQAIKEQKERKEICNDTVRSKFHKKVLHKFVHT